MPLLRPLPISALSGGIGLAILASLVRFPVGCNSSHFVCYADPLSWWLSSWPNLLIMGVGFLLISIGAFNATSSRLTLSLPAGMGIALAGFVLFLPSVSIGANVPAYICNGGPACPTFTRAMLWSYFWPSYVALAMSVLFFLIGGGLIILWVIRRHGEGIARRSENSTQRLKFKSRLPRHLKLTGFAFGVALGTVTFLFGTFSAPFPPFISGVSYHPALIWKAMLLSAPLLFATGFLCAGSAFDTSNEKWNTPDEALPEETGDTTRIYKNRLVGLGPFFGRKIQTSRKRL